MSRKKSKPNIFNSPGISQAYEHHSLLVSTNFAFQEWTEIFGSRLTGVISWKRMGKLPTPTGQ